MTAYLSILLRGIPVISLRKILFITSILLASPLANANEYDNKLPPPPEEKDFADYDSCKIYINRMMGYFYYSGLAPGDMETRIKNSRWIMNFKDGGTVWVTGVRCKDSTCTQYYGTDGEKRGSMGGCVLIASAPEEIRKQFITNLSNAYQLALNGKAIEPTCSPSTGYYFTGPKGVCTPDNKYAGCQFKIGTPQ